MKPNIHPEYHPVVFVDASTKEEIVTRSTATSKDSREIDGVKHFVISCDLTSFTHPFFTGKQKLVDSEGRIDRFRRKYAAFAEAKAQASAAETPTAEAPAEEG